MLLYGAPKPRRYAHHRTHCTAAMQDRLRNVERNRRLLESLGLLDVNLTKKSASQHRVCARHSPRPRPRPRPARVPLSKVSHAARHSLRLPPPHPQCSPPMPPRLSRQHCRRCGAIKKGHVCRVTDDEYFRTDRQLACGPNRPTVLPHPQPRTWSPPRPRAS